MESTSNPRRTQFSSCDACRKARVGCNASQMGYQPGERQWAGSCSRCSLRNKTCTFEWLGRTNPKTQRFRRNSQAPTPFITNDSFVSWEQSDKSLEASSLPRLDSETESQVVDHRPLRMMMDDAHIDHWCKHIFHQVFDNVFQRLVGNHGCPLIDSTLDESGDHATIFYDLDTLLDRQLGDRHSSSDFQHSQSCGEAHNKQVAESLRLAIRSFAVHWLPAFFDDGFLNDDQGDWAEVIRIRWRATRRQMLKTINQISYQSIFALYLFGQTPVPVGISEEEQLDGISGTVCIHTALKSIQQLRARLRSRPFDRAMEPKLPWPLQLEAHDSILTARYTELENRVYWAAMAWDTEVSLILNVRSSLGTGLRGACREPAWILARGFLLGSSRLNSEEWRREECEISDEVAGRIISAAGICRLYVWRTIASLKEALIEGVDEDSVQFAFHALLDGLGIFENTVQPALCNCQKWLQFLAQETRLTWYEVVLHYHLGVLIVCDTVEAAGRQDLLERVSDFRVKAERESFNALKFGLENQYFLHYSGSCHHASSDHRKQSDAIKLSLVAADPYPHYVVASVRLLFTSINRRRRQGDLSETAFMNLWSTLNSTLHQLPQSSIAVVSASKTLRHSNIDTEKN